MKKIVILFFVAYVSFSFASEREEVCSNVEDKPQCFVDELNKLFSMSVELKCDETVKETYAESNTIFLTLGDSKLVKEELFFILAHEFSHVLLGDTKLSDEVEYNLTSYINKAAGLSDDEIKDEIFLQISHENVDTLAAKILNEYNINIIISLKWFDRVLLGLPPDLALKLKKFFDKRKKEAIHSFREGWSNWSNFHYTTPVCEEGKLIDFLYKKASIEIIKKILAVNVIYNDILTNIYEPIIDRCFCYGLNHILSSVKSWREI